MDGIGLMDPELRLSVGELPAWTLDDDVLRSVRENMSLRKPRYAALDSLILPEERYIEVGGGAPDVRMLIWSGPDKSVLRPAIVHMHSGGFVLGAPEMQAERHRAMVARLGCVIVSVDYRLAPEARYPSSLDDCYAALKWTFEHADALGIDPKRIGVCGESAGGGLAAALALLARDRGEVPIAFQQLIYPMLDDRTCVRSDPHPHTGKFVWTAQNNHFGWSSLLGMSPGSTEVSHYAAPARAQDLTGLPPTYIAVGALDLFLDEDVDYAMRLSRAGVPVELHVYPGAFHGFHFVSGAAVTRAANRDGDDALARFFAS